MELSTVKYITEDRIAFISLNRPEAMNSMNVQLYYDIQAAFSAAAEDDDVKVIILGGEGRGFCAGGDVKAFSQIESEEGFTAFMELANATIKQIIEFPKPVIAAVHGAAAGAGASLLMAADIAIAAEDSLFIEAFGNVGLIPDMAGNYLLPRTVGRAMAKELVFTRRAVKAQEMLQLGLVNKVVPLAELDSVCLELARRIANGPGQAFAYSKEMINKSLECSLDEILKLETEYQTRSWRSEDGAEGMNAFLEKRKPKFK